jgi:hypothetical protein
MAAAKARGRRAPLLDAVRQQIEDRAAGPLGDLKAAQEILTYLSWLAWHCHRFAAVPTFLDAARSDVVAIVYAGAIGLERSAYLHARSLLENLVRHCYFESRPALFCARNLEAEDGVQDRWADQFKEIQLLPCFRPTWGTVEKAATTTDKGAAGTNEEAVSGGSALFAELRAVYRQSSRFVHGSTVRYRSTYEGISSIQLDPTRTEALGAFLQTLGEVCLLLLAMAHLGPYLLISQPIRRYMLEQMRPEARRRFLRCMQRVSVAWATHQRAAALATLAARKRGPMPSSNGLLLGADGIARIVSPTLKT